MTTTSNRITIKRRRGSYWRTSTGEAVWAGPGEPGRLAKVAFLPPPFRPFFPASQNHNGTCPCHPSVRGLDRRMRRDGNEVFAREHRDEELMKPVSQTGHQ